MCTLRKIRMVSLYETKSQILKKLKRKILKLDIGGHHFTMVLLLSKWIGPVGDGGG